MKAHSTRQLRTDKRYSFGSDTPWAKDCWTVYLHSTEDILRAIRYVENNPLKADKRKQTWSFVTPFNG
jgi:hypothetical protein